MDQTKQTSRTLTNETAKEPSFRFLYYGGSGAAVPFKWESQPGTPKHALFSDYSSLPPLTPPPSYLARSHREPDPKTNNHHHLHGRRHRLKIVVLLTRLVRRGSHVTPTSYSSSSSSSSETSYYSKGRKSRSLMVAYMDHHHDEEELEEEEMRMCFGGRLGGFKNALLAVVGGRCRRPASLDYFA